MTDWIVRGQANLLARSRSADIIYAKREWRVTYAYADLGTASGTCELCEHPRIRHAFEIENTSTSYHLWVGSECIKKFATVFRGGREIVDEEEKGRIVDDIVKHLRTADRRKRAMSLLQRLAEDDERFDDVKWADGWELGYSVKQLQWIAVAAKRSGQPFNAADFRINTRRGRVMEQLYELLPWQYRQLRGALTPGRRREADSHFLLNQR